MGRTKVKTEMPTRTMGTKGSSGRYDSNTALFNKAHDLGNGGIPMKFYDTAIGSPKTPKVNAPGMVDVPEAGVNQGRRRE